MMFMFCTAAPAAPLTRLSSAVMMVRDAGMMLCFGRVCYGYMGFAISAVVSGILSMMFMFCTAAPAAPLTRLSSAVMTTSLGFAPLGFMMFGFMMIRLLPHVSLVDGGDLATVTNGSFL